jgi:hypothetical protein
MSDRIKCDICGKSFNPSGYAQHVCVKQPATQMLTRKMAELQAKKKKKAIAGLPNDIARDGVFPQTTDSVEERMDAIKRMVRHLNEINLPRMGNIVGAVMGALKFKRLRGKHRKFYMKKYSVTGGLAN